ncbi:MAG: transcription antitermination factor NusB [bacterium]|nr:transcription antitermination factor NusB [bacterium]
MTTRRKSREIVMQMLYSFDIFKLSPKETWQSFFQIYKKIYKLPQNLPFIENIFFGTIENIVVIDQSLQLIMKNWELNRIASVDRAVLRMAAFEIFFSDDIPITVVINEAVDIAKNFSTEESGKFVNGIVDKLKNKRGTYERARSL